MVSDGSLSPATTPEAARQARDLQARDLKARDLKARALLQVWLSPAFPIGTFAYSHGLEKVVELGWVKDRTTLGAWVLDLVTHGSLPNDLVLLGQAYACAARTDDHGLRLIADLSSALQPTAERHLEATQQGQSFVTLIDAAWTLAPKRLSQRFAGSQPTVPVALGVVAEAFGIEQNDTALAFAIAFVSNLTSAAIRLSVIGQTDGQRIIAAVLPQLVVAAAAARHATLDDLGSAAFCSDIASMQHETQYTRLFRS